MEFERPFFVGTKKMASVDDIRELLRPIHDKLDKLDKKLNVIDDRTAFLFEATARSLVSAEYGSTFVKDLTARDVYALLKISLPKETYKKELGYVDIVEDGRAFLEVWGSNETTQSLTQTHF